MPRPRKVQNEAILDVIDSLNGNQEQYSSPDIGKALGLSRPTVNRRLQEMDGENWIRVKRFRDDMGHRRYTVRILAKGRRKLERFRANA